MLAHYSAALALHGALADAGAWYMFDWRGSGKSTRPPGSITFAGLVDDLEAVAEAIGEPFDLIAVNDGCGMALAFAARRPEMVRRMLLVSPMGEKTRSGEHYEMWIRTFATDPVMTLTYYLMWVHPGTDNAETFRIAKEAMAAKPLELVDELLHAANGVDLLDYAPHVNTPTFVLYTEGDEEDALELTARMPFARATNWTLIGDGTINGAAWRRAWDEIIPPRESGQSPAASGDPALAAALSPREAEILALVCRGLSNSEIAESLVIARSTAKRHVANIFAKLGVASRPQAMTLARKLGLD